MIGRRGFLGGLMALAAPLVVPSSSLMVLPRRPLWEGGLVYRGSDTWLTDQAEEAVLHDGRVIPLGLGARAVKLQAHERLALLRMRPGADCAVFSEAGAAPWVLTDCWIIGGAVGLRADASAQTYVSGNYFMSSANGGIT